MGFSGKDNARSAPAGTVREGEAARPGSFVMPVALYWIAAATTLAWGINWPMMKFIMTELEPLRFRSVVLISWLGLAAIVMAQKLPLRVPRGQWPRVVIMSLLNITAWNVLVMHGLQHMPSGRAVIIAYTMPVWAMIIGVLFANERLTPRRLLSVALGAAGMALLASGELQTMQRSPLGVTLLLGAAVSWAVVTVMLRHWPVGLPAISIACWQVLIGGIPLCIGSMLFEHGPWLPSSGLAWGALVFNVVFVSVLSLWGYTRIAMEAPVAVSSLSTLLIPVTGLLSGMAMLGERPQWRDWSALVLVVAALTIMLAPQWQRRRVTP